MTMMTQQKKIRHGLVLVAWLLLWGGLLVPARAYTEASLPQTWQRTPVMSEDVRPTYEFRSTSSYTATSGRGSSVTVGAAYSSRPRRGYWNNGEWVADDDLPVGEVDDPIPVGEPLVLLVLAMVYGLIMGWRRSQRRSTGSPMTLK